MTTIPKVRYGIIGFGRFAERAILPAIRLSANSEVVAIQKRSLRAALERAAALGVPRAYDTPEAMAADPAVDAVFIVSANAAHYDETLAAARVGKHVLVEKPIAMDAREALAMMRACAEHGVQLTVGHMVRLSPAVRRVRDLIRQGTLGAVNHASAEFVYDARLSHRSWLTDRRVAGGGPVYDIGVHCLDTLRFILDDEVVSVRSELSPAPTAERTELTAAILLRFGRGTIGSIYCSFASPVRRSLLEVTGTEGKITVQDFTLSETAVTLTLTRGPAGQSPVTTTEVIQVPNLYVDEVTRFSDCILTGAESFSPGRNGLLNQRVLDCAMVGGGTPATD